MLHVYIKAVREENKEDEILDPIEIRKAKQASYPDPWELGGHLGLLSVFCQKK